MLVSCVVCGINNQDNFSLEYYRFPKCPLRKAKWIHLLNLDKGSRKITSRSRVCQQHFSKSQIVRIKLIKNAMPKNLRKQAPPDQLQVLKGNERIMDMGMDEGLEEAIIHNNESTTKVRNPTGEVCLICAQPQDPLEINQPPFCANNHDSSFLNSHLWSMFVLKLLNFPNEECQNVFVKTFGVNPGDWFRLCEPCFKIMEQAFTLEQEVAKLQKQLELAKSNAINKLEESLKLDEIQASNKKNIGVFNITKYIRQVFKDIPDKELMECSTIKTEDDDKVEIDDCPNSTNETVISGCFDDGNTNTNMTVKTEAVDVEDTGKSSISNDNPYQNTDNLINKIVIKYSHYKNVETKIVKKLKVTAMKRCRLPESQEQKPLNKTADTTSTAHRPQPFRLTCSLCPAKFMRRPNLKYHLDNHNKYKATACPQCNFPCETTKKLKRHLTLKRCSFQGQCSIFSALSSASHENHEKCHICGRKYPGQIQLAKHLRSHHRHKHTTCPVCKLPCQSRRKLAIHMKICNFDSSNVNSGQVDEYKCDICGYKTDYPFAFSRHKRVHEQAKFNCELCSYPSLTLGALDIHMKEMHNTVVKIPAVSGATTCGRPEKDQLEKRKTSDELISCHLCPALFPSAWKVYRHVRNVHEIKCYRCTKCDTTFQKNVHLQNHLLEQHGIKKKIKKVKIINNDKFICDTCGMQFSGYSAIYVHKKKFHSNISDKSTTGERTSIEDGNKVSKYERKCPHCQVTCCNLKALKNHMRDGHPELYKHKCDLCPLTYISSGNLKIHMKSVHLKEEVECDKCKAKLKESSMRGHLKLHCRFRPQV